jgi:hypothetical protein
MKKGIMSLESIGFQSTDFLESLVKTIEPIRKLDTRLKDKEYFNSKEVTALSSCVEKYTNIKVNFGPCSFGAMVYLPKVYNSNVLINNDIKELSQLLDIDCEEAILKIGKFSKDKILKGSVDLKNAKVDGVFKEIQSDIFFDRKIMSEGSKLTTYELAAILIHEIGHIFTHLEYVTRSVTTNQSLSMLLKCLDKNITLDKKEIVFNTLIGEKNNNKEAVKLAMNAKSKQEVTIITLQQDIELSKSELGVSVYDYTSSEYLADQFAARFGASRYVVTALNKLNNNIRVLPLVINVVDILVAYLVPFYTMVILLKILSSDNKNIYDDEKSRYVRLKLQNIERLKDLKLPDELKNYFLDQNKEIDLIINNLNEYKDLYSVLAYWIKPGFRKEKDFEDLQKDLEKLSNNNLFEKAAQLSVI